MYVYEDTNGVIYWVDPSDPVNEFYEFYDDTRKAVVLTLSSIIGHNIDVLLRLVKTEGPLTLTYTTEKLLHGVRKISENILKEEE